ncbi:protein INAPERTURATE POLLEN1 [Juglans microcarpa x Juglans regia]|uniref:protein INAPERTURATE POLLEN1 n=1 Tax=Juglans microcarpa x Juglans regia TaxID=2249226 RepID=UPI001B7E0857|nr:protein INAPERTURATE POLLEN1 [Juglans microcarpa x Juglans regia]
MLKGLFTRKKSSRPFKDYYSDWFNILKNTLLPLLRCSISDPSPTLLSTHVEMLHHHFQSYYHALDLASSHDVAQLLFPDWRNSLEKPFLWLGDFHPYLFTNLIRSFINETDKYIDDKNDVLINVGGENCEFFDKPWEIAMAWRAPSKILMTRIDQVECGLRLMVPALANRVRKAQAGLVERMVEDWVWCQGRKETARTVIGEAVAVEMEEMVSLFLDANRLRRSVLAEIISATSVYQAALFLLGLAQFLIGLRDPALVSEFERCKTPLNKPSHPAL